MSGPSVEGDVPEWNRPHEIDVMWVPVCSVCQRGVEVQGDPPNEHWEHDDHRFDIPRP